MSSAAEEDTQRDDSKRRKALVLEEMMQQASSTMHSSEGEVGPFNVLHSKHITDWFILGFKEPCTDSIV